MGHGLFKIYFCIEREHDPKLVLLAGLLCIAASLATVVLLRQARQASGRDRLRWLCTAGLASGYGIWATHFIAVLGYDPGVVIGYQIRPTIASLIIASLSTTLGFWIVLRSTTLAARCLAALVIGGGIAAMHYRGMEAVELAGTFRWSAPYVFASILLAIAPLIHALHCAIDRRGAASALAAGLLIGSAILLLHFTGMAAITIVPSRMPDAVGMLMSRDALAASIAGTAFAVFIVGMVCALASNRARAAILASEREFRILVQGISDCALYMLDGDGRVVSWNAGAARLTGYTADEARGLDLASFYSSEDRAAGLPARDLAAARTTGRLNAEGWRRRKDGSRFWAHATIEPVHDELGAFRGFAKITRDMTRFKEDEDELRAAKDRLDAALSNMVQGLCLFDAAGGLLMANDQAGAIFGLTHEQCPPGTPFERLMRLALECRATETVPESLLREAIARHRACIDSPDGGTLVVSFTSDCILSISHRRMANGGWVTTFDDITERRRAELRIEHMALHDSLTGLPNRAKFGERLDHEIRRAHRGGSKLAVIGIDLDRFKEVNDAHGHAIGDRVLQCLSQRMTAALIDGEVVARFGGDEFSALKPFHAESELTDFIARLEGCLTARMVVEGLAVLPGASLGVAILPDDGVTREQIVNNADLAMYRAKTTVGRQVCFYEPGMDEAARARRVIANDLREAIGRDELSLAYQVQRAVATGRVTGFEALLRWQHPRDGWISPAEFIPVAEESGEILRIGEWVLRRACEEAARWEQPWRVAVNISPIQLMHVDLIGIVTRALVDAGLPAHRLELEITETAFVADKGRALHILRQLKALGVTIAIDDFGTGYSSLDTLNSFPFDKIKIDKSFLLDSEASHQARAIIRAVLALGRSLEVPVLAEGLESEEQLRLLRREGCDEAQGYLWGRPLATAQDRPEPCHLFEDAA